MMSHKLALVVNIQIKIVEGLWQMLTRILAADLQRHRRQLEQLKCVSLYAPTVQGWVMTHAAQYPYWENQSRRVNTFYKWRFGFWLERRNVHRIHVVEVFINYPHTTKMRNC